VLGVDGIDVCIFVATDLRVDLHVDAANAQVKIVQRVSARCIVFNRVLGFCFWVLIMNKTQNTDYDSNTKTKTHMAHGARCRSRSRVPHAIMHSTFHVAPGPFSFLFTFTYACAHTRQEKTAVVFFFGSFREVHLHSFF
jgi:hypothetical protein